MEDSVLSATSDQSHVYLPKQKPGGPRDGFQREGIVAFVNWQNVPLIRNGATVEDIIILARDRLLGLDLRLPCVENTHALVGLHIALNSLNKRTRLREAQGLEGTETPHENEIEQAEPDAPDCISGPGGYMRRV